MRWIAAIWPDRRDLAHSGVTLNLTLLSGCFQFRQPHPTVARITAIHLTRVLPPHCGPDHGDPPHKGFATPLWPGSHDPPHKGFATPLWPGSRRSTSQRITPSCRSTSQRFCHPILVPDHVDPPHKGFATPSWLRIMSIHLTRVLPPHRGRSLEASKSLSLSLPSFLPSQVSVSQSFFLSLSLSLSLTLSLSPSLAASRP